MALLKGSVPAGSVFGVAGSVGCSVTWRRASFSASCPYMQNPTSFLFSDCSASERKAKAVQSRKHRGLLGAGGEQTIIPPFRPFFLCSSASVFFFSSARDTDAGRARDANSVNEVPLKPWFLLFVFDSRALYT